MTPRQATQRLQSLELELLDEPRSLFVTDSDTEDAATASTCSTCMWVDA